MNTIMPNELSFDLDLNDLPTRASDVSKNRSTMMFGGRKITKWWCVDPGSPSTTGDDFIYSVSIWWGHTEGDATWACKKVRSCPNCYSDGRVPGSQFKNIGE